MSLTLALALALPAAAWPVMAVPQVAGAATRLAATVRNCTPAPPGDAFYHPPHPLPSGRHPGAGLRTAAPMGIEGYSQGGAAADWAAQLQPGYTPGLHLAGVAAGGTPANLQAVAANINGTIWFAFLAGTAIGFNAAYPTLHLPRELTPQGRAALANLGTMCQAQGLLTYAGKRIEDYTIGGINPIGQHKWQVVLDANNLGARTPRVPLFQYHGLADEIIPWNVESQLHIQYCARGVTTQLTGYPGDHVLTQALAQGDVVSWLGARFAGAPPPSNC